MTFDPSAHGWARDSNAVGFEIHAGMVWEKQDADGTPRFGLLVDKHHLNSRGFAHGGVFTAFADHSFGHLARRAGKARGLRVATISLSASFISFAHPGDFIEAKAEIVRQGRSLIFLQGRLTVGDRVVIAGDAVFMLQEERAPAAPAP
jgi:uncharacterized protein (TIGR00369 family)